MRLQLVNGSKGRMYLTTESGEVIENLISEVNIQDHRDMIDVTCFGDSHKKMMDIGGGYIETIIKFMDLKIVDESKTVVDPDLDKFLEGINRGGSRI